MTGNRHFFFSPLNTEPTRRPKRIRRRKQTEQLDNQKPSSEPPLCISGQPLTKAEVYWVSFLQNQAETGSLSTLASPGSSPAHTPHNSSPAVTVFAGPLGDQSQEKSNPRPLTFQLNTSPLTLVASSQLTITSSIFSGWMDR